MCVTFYEHLYLLNVYTQKVVELLEELSRKFAINSESLPHYQAMLQYVRASASHGLIDFMAGVEQTEAWLHQSQQRLEEEKLRDPDDVYISVRQRETERLRQRLPPRIQSLDESLPVKPPAGKMRKAGTSESIVRELHISGIILPLDLRAVHKRQDNTDYRQISFYSIGSTSQDTSIHKRYNITYYT